MCSKQVLNVENPPEPTLILLTGSDSDESDPPDRAAGAVQVGKRREQENSQTTLRKTQKAWLSYSSWLMTFHDWKWTEITEHQASVRGGLANTFDLSAEWGFRVVAFIIVWSGAWFNSFVAEA